MSKTATRHANTVEILRTSNGAWITITPGRAGAATLDVFVGNGQLPKVIAVLTGPPGAAYVDLLTPGRRVCAR